MILSALQFIVLLRFICQAMEVRYYNPVTQSVVKFSDYILLPFNLFGLKSNIYYLLLVLYVFTFFKIYLPLLTSSQVYPINSLLIISFGYLLKDLINIFWYLIIISAIKSWFNIFVNHPLFTLIDELCEPLYMRVRMILPTFSGIDFSPIVILFLLQLLEIILLPRIFNLSSVL